MRGPIGGAMMVSSHSDCNRCCSNIGFGALQINEGLNFLFKVPNNFGTQVILIIVATILFTWSAWSGIDKGIKTLSNINMGLAFLV